MSVTKWIVGGLFLIAGLLACSAEWSWAESSKPYGSQGRGYLKQDPIFKCRTNIYDETWERKGYLKEDSIFEYTYL